MRKNTVEEVIAPAPRSPVKGERIYIGNKMPPWRMFFESKVQDPDDPKAYKWRIFAYKAPTLAVLAGDFAMASPAARYLDKPRLAAKRRRAVERALRRGRRTQAAAALDSYTGA